VSPYAVEFRYGELALPLIELTEAEKMANSCLDWASEQVSRSGP
jgi:hypothetical protein